MPEPEPNEGVMRRVELRTEDGKHVAAVAIPPFDPPPVVLFWGTRCFVRGPNTPCVYYEAFCFHVPTLSGRPE